MRMTLWMPVALCGLFALGCAGGSATPVDPSGNTPRGPEVSLGAATMQGDNLVMPLGLYTIRLDVAGMNASIEPKQVRSMAAAGDDVYELCVNQFFPSPPVRISTITIFGDDLRLGYEVAHPFAAPTNMAGPATATNRADLGISGQCVFLAEGGPGTGLTEETFFLDATGSGGISMVTDLVTNADGLVQPKGLDVDTQKGFAFLSLVDETNPTCRMSTTTRAPISNGGSDTGNYDPVKGWQTSSIDAGNNENWNFGGYSVLHQGQTAQRVVDFSLDTLDDIATAGADFALDMAIIATYNDPRGGTTPAEKKRNRLPSSTDDPAIFFYDMPKGTCPLVSLGNPVDIAFDGTNLHFDFEVGDWSGGFSANPTGTIRACAPGLLGDARTAVTLSNMPSSGTGTPSFRYVFDSSVLAPPGTTPGVYSMCLEVTVPNDTNRTLLDCDLAPITGDVTQSQIFGVSEVTLSP